MVTGILIPNAVIDFIHTQIIALNTDSAGQIPERIPEVVKFDGENLDRKWLGFSGSCIQWY
jgi:hypothetical protein